MYCRATRTVHVLSNVLSYEIIKQLYKVRKYFESTKVQRCILRKYESTKVRKYLRRQLYFRKTYESTTYFESTKVLSKVPSYCTFVLSYESTFVLSYLISTANSVYIYYMYNNKTCTCTRTYEAYILPSKVHIYIQYVATYFRTKVHCTVSTYEGTTFIHITDIPISSNVRKYEYSSNLR